MCSGMERAKATFVVLILILIGLASSLLLLGMTFFQAYILSTWQGLPSIWCQGLLFALLILAGGFAMKELASSSPEI